MKKSKLINFYCLDYIFKGYVWKEKRIKSVKNNNVILKC